MKNNFKKLLCAVLAVTFSVSLLSACTDAGSSVINDKIKTLPSSLTEKFGDLNSAESVLKEIKNVDLYMTPQTDKLTVKTEKDDETDTSIDKYYDGDKLVYSVYNGYGEDGFDYYTKSKSGKPITVKYTDMDSKRYMVDIDGDGYTIMLEELNKEAPYGADTVIVTISESAENDLEKTVTYVYRDGEISMHGCYFDRDGYHYCGADPGENGFDSYDDIRYASTDKQKTDIELVRNVIDDSRVKNVLFTIGKHRLSYNEASSSQKQWYFTDEMTVVLSDKQSAEAFADEHNLEVIENDEKYTVVLNDITLGISDEFENFVDFATIEIDDWYFSSFSLDESGMIKSFEKGNDIISYY